LHFGYRDSAWTASEMDMANTTTEIETAREAYDDNFKDVFM